MSDQKMRDDKTKIDLGLLEEDDDFEEFPAEGIKLVIAFWFSQKKNYL